MFLEALPSLLNYRGRQVQLHCAAGPLKERRNSTDEKVGSSGSRGTRHCGKSHRRVNRTELINNPEYCSITIEIC